jgi:phage I-like protein
MKLDELLEQDDRVVRIILDKTKFATLEIAITWARENGFYYVSASETDLKYVLDMYAEEYLDLFELESELVEYGEGVTVEKKAYKEIEKSVNAEMVLSLNNINNIKFSDTVPTIIEMAKVIKGYHASYGEIEIKKEHLKSFVKNFKEKVTGCDLSIDLEHSQGEACGWVNDLYLSQDEETLFGVIKWNPLGALSLTEKRFRYYSPEFSFSYTHPHTLTNYGPTLLGGALVNRPFLKMDAIVSMTETKIINKENEMTEKTILLVDHESKVLELSEKVKTAENKVIELTEKINNIEKEKIESAKKAKFDVMLSEGKACEAQRVAFMSGDLESFISLSMPLKTDVQGNGGANADVVIELSEAEKKICKELGLTHAEFIAANSGSK